MGIFEKEQKQKFIFRAGVILLIGIGFWCLIRIFFSPERVWKFDGAETAADCGLHIVGDGIWFDAGVIDQNKRGWYIDNSMEYGDVFAETPPIDLDTGSYDITISYQADDVGNEYSFLSHIGGYRNLRVGSKIENEGLDDSRLKVTLKRNVFWPEKECQVQVSYGGNGYLILNQIGIRQNRDFEKMILFWIGVFGIVCLCWVKVRKNKELRLLFWTAFGVAVAASIPILTYYMPGGDDLYFHLLRIEGMVQAWKSGQFPARIQPVWINDYGYPVSVFYGEGIYCLAGFFRWIGFSTQTAYKMYLFGINVLSFLVTSYSIRRIFGNQKIALMGGAIYTLAPYRLINIYVRAAVGEYTAMAFFPLILAGFYEILTRDKNDRRMSWALMGIGMTGLIQSHVLSTEIVGGILILTCFLFLKPLLWERRVIDLLKAAFLTVLLNLGFLVPFLHYYLSEDLNATQPGFGGWIQDRGVFLSQLLNLFPYGWGKDYPFSMMIGQEMTPEVSYGLGIVFMMGIFGFLYVWKENRQERTKEMQLGKYCLIMGVILAWMSTIYFPWNYLIALTDSKLLRTLQFPWRLLGPVSILFTMVCCVVLQKGKENGRGKKNYGRMCFLMIGALVLLTGYFETSLLRECEYVYVPTMERIDTFSWLGGAEYLPTEVEANSDLLRQGEIKYEEFVTVASFDQKGTTCILNCRNHADDTAEILLPLLYYSGYEAIDVDTGGPMEEKKGENGRICLLLPGHYQGTVKVEFKEPFFWRISEVVSLISAIAFAGCWIKGKGLNFRMILRKKEKIGSEG